jgi:hypothetical protein
MTIEGKAGDFIRGHGFSIDAQYDARLDSLVTPYKVLSIAIRNTSLNVIQMDAKKDTWVIVDRRGKSHRGFTSIRKRNPKRWESLPREARELMEYPELVPINYTATFNIFFPRTANLEGFQEIRYNNATFRESYRIYKQ